MFVSRLRDASSGRKLAFRCANLFDYVTFQFVRQAYNGWWGSCLRKVDSELFNLEPVWLK